MKPEEQRIVIAKVCGWIFKPQEFGWSFTKLDPKSYWLKYREGSEEPFPDYLNDLNAMHEAEKFVKNVWGKYVKTLNSFTDPACATATQRAEAFLRTLNLYTP